jgi:DNA ligase (NAD+)
MTEQTILEQALITYNEAYRQGNPIISDQQYDSMIERLKKEHPKSDLLKKGVIEKAEKTSRKQKLPIPMYSLNKCKSIDEIRQWAKSKGLSPDTEIVITPKYDGISLVVDETTKQCWTRGDGEVGQDSKCHFEKLNRYGDEYKFDIFSFGEAIMSKANFQKYKDEYANPRNMVAGLFNRDITTMPLQDVDYIRYGSSENNINKGVLLYSLNNLNKVDVDYRFESIKYLDEDLLNKLYKEWSKDYQIDGLVIDVNDKNLRNTLGREENMNPAYAVAYKNPEWSSSAEVKVLDITWQVSKQGKLKPVIQIEPTEVGGVMISNVTGYNAKYIFDNNIAKRSIIQIVRSGDVIPKHISTISFDVCELNINDVELALCPSCEKQVKWDETFTELICTNPDCKEKKIMKLVHFFSTLEIEDFGEPSIRKFYEAGFTTPQAIFRITKKEIENIEGFGSKSAVKLTDQFFKIKSTGIPAAKTIQAFDIMDGKIGEKTIQLIFDNLEEIELTKLISIPVKRLLEIEGVAEITASIFLKGIKIYFEDDSMVVPFPYSYIQTPKAEVKGDKYSGWKLCFTGCRPSKELEQKIQSEGGEIVSGVSKNTTHLVVKDVTSTSSKMQKAKDLGVKIMSINEIK